MEHDANLEPGMAESQPILLRPTLRDRIHRSYKTITKSRGGVFGLCLVFLMVFCALLAPYVSPFDPNAQDILERFSGPTFKHFLGTDYLGRDILSRLIYGCRIAIFVSFGAVSISVIIGVVIGVAAGYRQGTMLDYGCILLFDILLSFPQIILALAFVAVLGPSLLNLVIALAVTSFPFYGRIARAQTLSVKESDYVKTGKALGLRSTRIIFKHILPNILTPIIICMGMDMATMIVYEAGLSFLGLGVKPPTASWGIMLQNGYKYILTSPWMILWPSLAIALAMIAFTLLSEGLRVVFDPKERMR